MNRVCLQRNAQYSFLILSGQDTILDFAVDSLFISYETDSSGIFYTKKHYGYGDTVYWNGKPYQQVVSSEGKKYMLPKEVNSSTLATLDGTNFYLFNRDGLPIRKEVIIGSLDSDITVVNYHSLYSIEYQFRDNKP